MLLGVIIGKRRQQGHPNRQGICKVRRKFYLWSAGSWKTSFSNCFITLQDLKTATHSIVATFVFCLLGIAVETALAAAQSRDTYHVVRPAAPTSDQPCPSFSTTGRQQHSSLSLRDISQCYLTKPSGFGKCRILATLLPCPMGNRSRRLGRRLCESASVC